MKSSFINLEPKDNWNFVQEIGGRIFMLFFKIKVTTQVQSSGVHGSRLD